MLLNYDNPSILPTNFDVQRQLLEWQDFQIYSLILLWFIIGLIRRYFDTYANSVIDIWILEWNHTLLVMTRMYDCDKFNLYFKIKYLSICR